MEVDLPPKEEPMEVDSPPSAQDKYYNIMLAWDVATSIGNTPGAFSFHLSAEV